MVCHCLLIETDDGLVLVDTGLGTEAVRSPHRWLGLGWLAVSHPRLDVAETARYQVEALGFAASDVRHILLTHLDLDHAGGLADFPQARVHVMATEFALAVSPHRPSEHRRYRGIQWAHDPRWVLHEAQGEGWFGFEGVRAIEGLGDEILMVPLAGHTTGHAGVAIRTGDGWLLHAGDAYFARAELENPSPPLPLALMHCFMESDRTARLQNLARLHELDRTQGEAIRIFCAHDPLELERFQG